ncbi:hypothetical protein Gogos_010921 [Gossypium gossypioides]|uniref:PGG domain-containing protein n=1 Tax=Gossypium gossypioides TaxID=34282 RepID=A0A7J9BMP1_GOSGO|nr:hypothetical protein [Gossypium gossypioides]
MDPKLHEALITGGTDALHEFTSESDSDSAFLQVTTEEDNILHLAAKYNQNRMAEEMITTFPTLVSLVNQKNSKGDTPLHVTARSGSFETAQILVNCANSGEIEARQRATRIVNMVNDTALHDAVRNGHLPIAELLIREDPELPDLTNDAGESPLFIAVDKKHVDIAEIILQVARVFSFAGRNSMNVLHAAVIRSQDEVLRISSYMVKLPNPMNYLTNMSFKLAFKLASFGPSAFIQAASQNHTFRAHFGAVDIFKVFLDHIDSSTARKRDKQGMTVIHIAAREGEVTTRKELAYKLPEIWDLQDNKGQPAFHLAVERGKLDCVKFILATKLSHYGLINQKDNEGNTALHLATMHGKNQQIFELLIKDCRVDKSARNMEGFTVIDIILLEEYGYFEKNMQSTRSTESTTTNQEQPQTTWSPFAIEAQPQLIPNKRPKPTTIKKPSSDQLHTIARINLLVITLIATVSFAAGFIIPGGYKSDGPEEGMAILSRKLSFRVFVIANALAFCFSSTSMLLYYCKSFVEKLDAHAFYTYITSLLMGYGTNAMVIAFVSGTYAALSNSPGLAKAVLSIGASGLFISIMVMASLKYEILLLDRNPRFALWQIKMQAVLAQMDLEEALLRVDKMSSTLTEEEKKRKDRKALTQLHLHLSNKILQDVMKEKTAAGL